MQINGLREFAANFMPSFQDTAGRNQAPAAKFLSNTDVIDVSGIGKSTRPEDLNRTRFTNDVQASSSDAITSLMDSSLTTMENILEEMHALTVKAAEDESLNELDRMLMQTRMEDLRMEFYNTSRSMNEKLAKMAGYEGELDQVALEPPTNDGGVLDRALKRLDEGKPWDVAEAGKEYRTYTHISLGLGSSAIDRIGDTSIYPEEGEMVTLTAGEDMIVESKSHYENRLEAYVVKEADRYIYTKNLSFEEIKLNARYIDKYGIDGAIGPDGLPDMEVYVIPTVREKMEEAGTIILMDAKSAKEGVKRLEYEMEKFRAMKEEFEEFKADPQRNRSLTTSELESLNTEYEAMLADLRAKQEAGEESWATKLFLTELGIMKTDGMGNNPRLVHTAGPKGSMFSKLDRFFRSAAGNLSDTFIDENLYITDIINTNLTWETEPAE